MCCYCILCGNNSGSGSQLLEGHGWRNIELGELQRNVFAGLSYELDAKELVLVEPKTL